MAFEKNYLRGKSCKLKCFLETLSLKMVVGEIT